MMIWMIVSFFCSCCHLVCLPKAQVSNTFLHTCSLILNIFTSRVIYKGKSSHLIFQALDSISWLMTFYCWSWSESIFFLIDLCLKWLLVFTRVTCVLRQLGDLFYLFCKVNCHCIYSWIRWLWFRVWWNSHHSLSWCWTRQPNSPREVREVCLQWECLQQVSRDMELTNHWTRQNIEDQGPFHAMTVLGQRFWHLNYIEEVLDSQKPKLFVCASHYYSQA